MGALDALIYGVRDVFADAIQVARRARLSFGPEFELTDDVVNEWTRVAVRAFALKGNSAGLLLNTADVVQWDPTTTTALSGFTVACGTSTTDADPHDMSPILGSPALELDDDDMIIQASAIVLAKKDGTDADFATWRVSRSFVRDGAGTVNPGNTTADDGKDRQGTADSTPWVTPILSWDTSTKFPKITVESDEAEIIKWRAILAVIRMVG